MAPNVGSPRPSLVPVGRTTRRRALSLILGSLATPLVTGCSRFCRRPVCPGSPTVSRLGQPLTIDAHCHVFNASDLQVKQFFSMVLAHQSGHVGDAVRKFGSILQTLGWHLAPSGSRETAMLERIRRKLEACDDPGVDRALDEFRQESYAVARQQLQRSLETAPEFRSTLELLRARPEAVEQLDMSAQSGVAVEIMRLPELFEEFQRQQAVEERLPAASARSVGGMLKFVNQNFQYRFVTTFDYLKTYNQSDGRVIDLMLPSMVDYDWWLNGGHPTDTPIPSQIKTMEMVSVLTRGRVHAFVPFDPLREVAWSLGKAEYSSFEMVKDGIEKRGCVGVKLYPPMGFAPYGNAEKQKEYDAKSMTSFWRRDWLPGWMDQPKMGEMLDRALGTLYQWCEAEQVPLMAHTNLTNGVISEFEYLAGYEYWKEALRAFPDLRISFGHFGDSSPIADSNGRKRALQFAELMSPQNGAVGTHAYADSGYFTEVLGEDQNAVEDRLRDLYATTVSKGIASLARRFMYGTDWEMTLLKGDVGGYLERFVQVFAKLDADQGELNAPKPSQSFFGDNAVDWIGLRRGDRARIRLESFYKENAVAVPDWMVKVDRSKRSDLVGVVHCWEGY